MIEKVGSNYHKIPNNLSLADEIKHYPKKSKNIIVDMINDKPDTFRIFALRSFGESLYYSITDSSLEFGYIGK